MQSAILNIGGFLACIAGFLGVILNENDATNWMILAMLMFILDEIRK